ncbi:MAG: hypothetical protein ABSF82_07370 [Candidatus Bathyarchaeia archaeon]
MTNSNIPSEQRTWVYSFLILVLVTVWMLALDLKGSEFLAFDFQVALVYLPTVIAGIIVAYLTLRTKFPK